MSKERPLVSVICLCYNHGEYIRESVDSVLDQDYPNIELIIVDDASNDHSQQLIKSISKVHPDIQLVMLEQNIGNCAAFNTGLELAKGKYIIDLAADDFLYPQRISRGVESLEQLGEQYGVHYCDAEKIDASGVSISQHITSSFYSPVPEGYIFKELLEKYFINPVSMMLSRQLLDALGGYDENLAYEDFDLWIRSSKQFKYCYSPEILVAKRQLKDSHSSTQYKFKSKILLTTFNVCQKALALCETRDEFIALKKRINFEMRKSIQSFNLKVAKKFYLLLEVVRKQLRELS